MKIFMSQLAILMKSSLVAWFLLFSFNVIAEILRHWKMENH